VEPAHVRDSALEDRARADVSKYSTHHVYVVRPELDLAFALRDASVGRARDIIQEVIKLALDGARPARVMLDCIYNENGGPDACAKNSSSASFTSTHT